MYVWIYTAYIKSMGVCVHMHKISQDLIVLSEQFCDFLALSYIATFSFPVLGNDAEWRICWLSGTEESSQECISTSAWDPRDTGIYSRSAADSLG